MAAYNTATTIAREIRTNNGKARATQEAHNLMRQVFNQTGDIDTTASGSLTIIRVTLAIQAKIEAPAELCEHLATTQTRCPGTERILKCAIQNKTRPQEH